MFPHQQGSGDTSRERTAFQKEGGVVLGGLPLDHEEEEEGRVTNKY